MFKKLHPVYKAVRRIANYCEKHRFCIGCLFLNDEEKCILHDMNKFPVDWVVPRKEDKHDKG